MEATGVYWTAPWAILEDEFECMLVNARHVKQVPGRKTDVSDAAWLCQLAEAGLLKANFVPPKPIRQLRNLTRYRKTQIQERAREVNRLHKALEDAGIKLGHRRGGHPGQVRARKTDVSDAAWLCQFAGQERQRDDALGAAPLKAGHRDYFTTRDPEPFRFRPGAPLAGDPGSDDSPAAGVPVQTRGATLCVPKPSVGF
jgi:transposase